MPSAWQRFWRHISTSLRAQTVAYALAWLVEKSGRKIDLNRIWEKQALPDPLAYIKGLAGNPTEAAKKPDCWEKFQRMRIELDAAWEKSLGQHAFIAPRSDMEAVELEWERLRPKFANDKRTVMGMAVRLGKDYPANCGGLVVGHLAALDWEKLKMKQGFGPKKVRQIVELFAVAAGR